MYLDQCRQSVKVLSPPRAVRTAEQPAVPRLFNEKGDGFSLGERQEGGVCRGRVGHQYSHHFASGQSRDGVGMTGLRGGA